MPKISNPRGIGGGSGRLIGSALSPRELQAVATAVQAAAVANDNAAERMALKTAFAKFRSAHLWQAKNQKSRGL
jgi:hypothetical protein